MILGATCLSRPVRARGLKLQHIPDAAVTLHVAPRAGAWLETMTLNKKEQQTIVAPRAGAWLETIALWKTV